MPLKDMLILITPPDQLTQARETGLTIGHMAYRIGRGPHLFRSGPPKRRMQSFNRWVSEPPDRAEGMRTRACRVQ